MICIIKNHTSTKFPYSTLEKHCGMYATNLAVVLLSAMGALAAPSAEIIRRASITTYSSTQITTFKPFTYFASAGYCNPSATINWSCGGKCNITVGCLILNNILQPIARRTLASCPLLREVTATVPNSVSRRSARRCA